MGFLASDLADICMLRDRVMATVLAATGIHPTQIQHLLCAADDCEDIAMVPPGLLAQLDQTLHLTPGEYARLRAAREADIFLRLLYYHNYHPIEAMQKANAVYAAARKDYLATGGRGASIYPPRVPPCATPPRKPRGRRPKGERKSPQADTAPP